MSFLLQSPRADVRDIKQAYYAIMKDCHPDLSGDEESTEFCMLLNEIYEVCFALQLLSVVLSGIA
jgi:DnaJ-class molecular chaperone